MIELLNLKNPKVDIDEIKNKLTSQKNISLSVLRLDKIHPEISGNKIFKLCYFLERAISAQKKIITIGGAYSNHLSATASACNKLGINCIGIVRGEEPKNYSQTLLFCKQKGMQLEFITRQEYKIKDQHQFIIKIQEKFGDHIYIPEGGYCPDGVEGAGKITRFYNNLEFTHVSCSVGTATTLAGLLKCSRPSQNIVGFGALKNMTDVNSRLQFLLGNSFEKQLYFISGYEFGGYAKKSTELLSFMNKFYAQFDIPTDFIYTAKMFFGIFDLIKKNHFPEGSKILCIHTGGLQGNLSLPAGTLKF